MTGQRDPERAPHRAHRPSVEEVEAMLREIAESARFPPTPNLAPRVARRLTASRATPASTPRRALRLLVGSLAAVLRVLIVATSASAALAWLADLEFPGMRIVINERSAPPALPESAEFVLGERVSLAEARGTAGFELEIPAELGEPDEVYVHAGPGGTFVTFVYAPRPGLPEAEETGVGALLYQFVSPGGLVGITKSLGPATVMRWTDVHGADALWLEGGQVSILTWTPAGTLTTSGRPSAHVLIWQAGGVTYRLETVLGTEEAVRIAESLSPLPADAAAIRP